MRFVSVRLFAAAAILGGVTPVLAFDKEAAKKACMADYKKFCSGIMPGGGRVKKCLNDNLDKLSPDCRAQVASAPQ